MVDITIDFETMYSDEYTLRKMTTREYIMDERFEVMLLAVKVDDQPRRVLEPHEIRPWLAQWDWSTVRLCAHNMNFDGAILAWHYGYRPKLYECTMFMGQAVVGHVIGSASLADINAYYGRTKDSEALTLMKGLPFAVAREQEGWERYKAYAGQDADDARAHVKTFRALIPNKYRLVIDLLCRMYIDSRLELDADVLDENLRVAAAERERLLTAAGMTDGAQLRSAPKFAKLLADNGVNDIPMKVSPSTGEMTYAFAKKDLAFIELLDHWKPEVRMLVEARLNAASSIEETRTKRFQRLAALRGSNLNVPLMFSGAHTHRFSGRDSLNLQNLPRKSLLRKAIRAPKGYKLVVRDASQIEARILAWLAGCLPLLKAFANKEDVYSIFASSVFGYPVNKKDHPGERFVGKTCILGLGYMTGADTLYRSMVLGAQSLGIKIDVSHALAKQAVDTYRMSYPEIPMLWSDAGNFIRAMAMQVRDYRLGPFSVDLDMPGSPGWIISGGIPVRYPRLQWQDASEGYGFKYWRHRYNSWTSIYGGKMVENMGQHLAWTVIVNAMVSMRLYNPDWLCVLQVHDELAYLVPDGEEDEAQAKLHEFMCQQPDWLGYGPLMLPVPLDAEGDVGEVYGDCK